MYTFVQPRGGGVSIFSPKPQKCHVYFCTTKGGGGSRRDPNHKSMYKCAYMYVHLSLSPPPPPPPPPPPTGILITGKDEKRRRTVVQGKVLSISFKTLRHLKHHKEKEMLDREREDLRWRSVLSTICLPSVG